MCVCINCNFNVCLLLLANCVQTSGKVWSVVVSGSNFTKYFKLLSSTTPDVDKNIPIVLYLMYDTKMCAVNWFFETLWAHIQNFIANKLTNKAKKHTHTATHTSKQITRKKCKFNVYVSTYQLQSKLSWSSRRERRVNCRGCNRKRAQWWWMRIKMIKMMPSTHTNTHTHDVAWRKWNKVKKLIAFLQKICNTNPIGILIPFQFWCVKISTRRRRWLSF